MTDPLREALNEMQTKLAEGWQEQERRAQGGIFGTSISDIVYNFPVNIEPVGTQYIRWTTQEGYDSWTLPDLPPEPEWQYVEDFAGQKLYRRVTSVGRDQWTAVGRAGVIYSFGPYPSRLEICCAILRNRDMPVRRAADGGLVGWRYWTLGFPTEKLSDAILVSPHQGTEWSGPTLSAERWSRKSACEGHAGIHASLRPMSGFEWPHLSERSRPVTGRVRGYGRYVLGTRGWRAERVVIDYLRVPADIYDEVKGPLSDRYACEVRKQWR